MESRTDDLGELSFDQLMELERRAEARAAAGGGDDAAGGGADDGPPGSDDGILVLPWWQHPVNVVTMVLTAAILAAMIGWMIGENASRPAHGDVDTGFLQDMRLHHEQAIFMGFVYRDLPDTDPELRAVAASIVQGQSLEVGRMVQLLRSFGAAEARDLDDTAIGWGRATWNAFAPYATGGVYLNFAGLSDEADDARSAAHGASASRLGEIRDEYDPDGLFATAAGMP